MHQMGLKEMKNNQLHITSQQFIKEDSIEKMD